MKEKSEDKLLVIVMVVFGIIGVLLVSFFVYTTNIAYETLQQQSLADAEEILTSMVEIPAPVSWEYNKIRAVILCPGGEPFIVKNSKKFGSEMRNCAYYVANGVELKISTRFFSKKGSIYFSINE